jgi:glycerophosphoryl diester phosphodiesterase
MIIYGQRLSRADQLSPEEIGDRGILYMPVVSIDQPESVDIITAFLKVKPVAVECNMSEFNETAKQNLERLRNAGIKIWMNSIWPSLNAGHDDDRAVELFQPDESWGWILNQGTTIIQSDRCKELLRYLDMRKMR